MRGPYGTLAEALVLGRIWSTSKGDGLGALDAAGTERDASRRVQEEFDYYAWNHRKQRMDDTHRGRIPIMKRPGVVVDAFQHG